MMCPDLSLVVWRILEVQTTVPFMPRDVDIRNGFLYFEQQDVAIEC